jgi:hypothetical protein
VLKNTESQQVTGNGDNGGDGIIAAETVMLPVTVQITVGLAVEGLPFALDISMSHAYQQNGIASILLTGVPQDAILESATEGLLLSRMDGTYLMDADSDSGLMMTPPHHFIGDVTGMEAIVTTTDGITHGPAPFSVTVLPFNDRSYLAKSAEIEAISGDAAAILDDLLAIRDVDDQSDAVVYEVTELPQFGTLFLGSTILDLGGTFSQFDIDNGLLTYEQVDPAPSSDTFSFRAEDGQYQALGTAESAAPSYTIIDGEATFNIAVQQDVMS